MTSVSTSHRALLGLGILGAAAMFAVSATTSHAATTGELLPVNDGFYQQMDKKPTSASNHYTLVDESVCNGKTDFLRARNGSAHVGERDSQQVDISSIPAGSTITDIVIAPCASRNSKKTTGTSQFDVFYRFDGTDSADAGAYALPAGANVPLPLATTTFSGLSHVVGSSSILEIGGVYTSGNRGVRLSRIAAYVTYTEPAMPPAAPTNLSGFATSTGTTSSVLLLWTDNADNETSFTVERANGTSTTFAVIGGTPANTTFFTDMGLSSGLYSYRVKAVNGVGSSAYSNTALVNVF